MSRRSLLIVFLFCVLFCFFVFLLFPFSRLPLSKLRFAAQKQFLCLKDYDEFLSFFFSRYGDGYTVTLRIGGEEPNLDAVSEFISSLFPGAVLKVRNSADFALAQLKVISLFGKLPRCSDKAKLWSDFITRLERQQFTLELHHASVSKRG